MLCEGVNSGWLKELYWTFWVLGKFLLGKRNVSKILLGKKNIAIFSVYLEKKTFYLEKKIHPKKILFSVYVRKYSSVFQD